MKCKEARRRLSIFLDNELSQKEALEIKGHISQCVFCAKEAEALSAALGFIKELGTIEPPLDFWDNLSKKIIPQEERVFSYGFFRRVVQMPVPAAASFILVVGLLLGIYLGNALYLNAQGDSSKVAEAGADNFFYLASLDDLPSDSVGGVYIKLAFQK